MQTLKFFFKNKIVKNAGWLILGKITQMLLSLVVGILSARYLGPGNYGLINYAGAYTVFFTSICNLGINSVIVKELIDDLDNNGTILGTSIGLRAISSILSAVTITGLSFMIDRDDPVTVWVVALYSISLVFYIFETFRVVFPEVIFHT
jgi:O-antigen/teichoic acid export membrane protein